MTTEIERRLVAAQDVTAEFSAICDEVTTKKELVMASDTLDALYHAGLIAPDSVNWVKVTHTIGRRMFGDNPVSSD